MRGETESRAEKYIRNHKNRKKWLAFVLCLSLFTGTATLYGLNKPATAMTEEGAGQVGLVMETADNEFEQGLIEQMQEDEESGESSVSLENEEEGTAEETSNEESGNATPETVSETDNEIQEEENSPEAGAAAAMSSEASNAASSEDESGVSSSASSASTVKESASEASGVASSGSSLDAEKSTNLSSGKAALDIPESVDLLEYVTETIIERKNADGEWEVIDKDDIKPADKLRITFNYVLPKEAVVSDDIHLEIPEEFGTAETDAAELDDGKGSYEVTEDNQLIIQYSDEVKEEIINEAGEIEEENSDEATSLIGRIDSFFDLFSLTAYAADSTSGSATVYTTVAGMTITGVTLVKNPDEKVSGSSKTYSGGTPISSGAEVTAGDKLYFTIEYNLAKNTVSAENPTITYNLAEHGIEVYEAISGMVYNSENEAVGTFAVEKSGLVTITYYPEFAAKNSTQEIEGDFYFVEMASANSDSEKTYKEYVFDDDLKVYIYIVKGDSYDLTLEKKASSYDETNKTIDYTIVISSNNGTGTSGITLTDVLTVYNNSLTDKNLNTELTSKINLKEQLEQITIKKSDGTNIASGNAVSVGTDGTATISLPDLGKGESYTITYTFNVPESVAGTDTPVKVNNSVKAVFDEEKNRSYTVETDINGNVPNIDKYGTADTANKTVTWTIKLNSLGNNLNGYTLKDFIHTLAENGWSDVSTPYVGSVKVSSVSTPSGKTASLKVGQEISLDENGYTFTSDDYSTYEFTYTYTYTVFDLKWGSLVNEASITKELNGETYGDDKTASVYTGDNTKVVEKTADGIDSATDDASTVLVKWNVTIHAPIKCNEGNNNSEYWSFTDAIQDSNEYLSESQLSDLKSAIKQAGYNGNLSVENGENVTVGGVSGYKGFVIKFYSDLTTDLTFTYYTTGYIGDGNNTTSFTNFAYVRSQSYSSTGTQNYEPIIAKYDGKGTHSDSAYDYYSTDLLESGILTWRIKINIPEICNYETLTATDTLPDGVSLIDSYTYKGTDYYGLEIADNDSFNGAVAFSGGSATYLNTSFYESIDGQNVKVTFSPSNLQGKTLYLRVRAKIDDPDWTSATNGIRTFANSVSLKNEGGNELGGDSQTQNITKTETALEKTSNSNLLDAKDTIEYTLEVNENAADLLEGSDELTLTDTLQAKSQSSFGATLVAGHIKVYEVVTDSAGNETLSELSTDEYSYSVGSYETKASYYGNGQDDGYYSYNTIEFKIPDKKHLRIVYRYTFSSDSSGQVSIIVSNKATLKGIAEDKGSSDTEKTIILEEAGAKADVHGINIYKVDNENNAIVLSGAEFALYKWTGSSWQRIIYDSSSATWQDSADDTASEYISGEDGLVALQHLTYNQAYKLVETKAPKGYLLKSTPLYFYMPSADTTTYSMNIPSGNEYTDGNEIVAISQGTDYNFTNTKTTTSITVNKYWENADETMPASITVKLGRRLGTETTEAAETYHSVNIEQRNPQSTIIKYIGLPSVIDGSTLKVTFWTYKDEWNTYAQEITVNGVKQDFTADNSGLQQVTVCIEITGDTVVRIKPSTNAMLFDYFSYELSSPEVEGIITSGLKKDEPGYMTLTLTKSGGWTTTIDNLERYYYVYDDDGNIIDRYLWLYYVSEVNNVYYTAEYTDECKTGINSGTLEFTNKRNNVVPYSLPETGGIGKVPFEMSGIFLVIIAILGLFINLFMQDKTLYKIQKERTRMKRLKKLLTGILAGAMALTMAFGTGNAVKAEAAEEKHTITVENASNGQSYTLYKLFNYEPSAASESAGVYKVTDDNVKAFLNTQKEYVKVDENGYVTWVNEDTKSDTNGKDTAIAAFAKNVQAAIEDGSLSLTAIDTAKASEDDDKAEKLNEKDANGIYKYKITFEVSDYGYYLVSSTLGALVSIDTTSSDATVYEKNTTPTIDKGVEEDSVPGVYGDKNDAQIGQVVNYQVVVNAKAGGTNYKIHDAMDEGLTFDPGSVKFSDELPTGVTYELVTEPKDGDTFDIVFNGTFAADATIKVTYSALVNEKAVVSTAIVNDTYLEYNNKATTEHDSTETYVYAFNLYKNDGEETALAGAKFEMKNGDEALAFVYEKKDESGVYVFRVASAEEAKNASAIVTKDANGNVVTPVLTAGVAYKEIITPESGKVFVRGLDADSYTLTETEAPVGYNLLTAPKAVIVKRAEDVINGKYLIDGAAKEGDVANVVSVINNTGSLLPSTGGMGTTLFYIFGAILIIAGVAYFIVRRKADAE